MEALIRWRQNGTLISPLEFIPLAEETGLIVPIGRWVLATACNDIAALCAEGCPNLKLAVNISAIEFKQSDIETEEQLQFLGEEGCCIGQGYLISRPQTLDSLRAWLKQQQAA